MLSPCGWRWCFARFTRTTPTHGSRPQTTTARRREAIHALYQSLPDLYNPAQIRVIAQAYHLAQDDGPSNEADV